MEIVQNAKLKISNIEDSEMFIDFMEEEGGIFADEIEDVTEAAIEIEVMEVYETFENMLDTLKSIVTAFPNIKLSISGEEETTYDGIEYMINYEDKIMTINTTDRFYKRYPEDYDEFIGFCEEFNIEDVFDEGAWETMNEEADGEWYFIDGVAAQTSIKLSNKEIVKL